MHLPDGFLEPEVLLGGAAVSAAGIGVALKRLSGSEPTSVAARQAPVVGLAAAFVFAAQMVNFPVATAVSGHLSGAALLGILFGPWLTLPIMSSVLILQAFLFQDGGVTALGVNIFNLAIVANFAACAIYRSIKCGAPLPGGFGMRESIAAFLSAWGATLLAALAVALELTPSGVASLETLVLWLGGTHLLIGLGEALITVMILKALHRSGIGVHKIPGIPSIHGEFTS